MEPYLIDFQTKGSTTDGYLNIITSDYTIPFAVKRVFWTSAMPQNITRGRHAHHETEMVIVAACGTIHINTLSITGTEKIYILNKSGQGLFLPKLCWHEMQYSTDALQIVMANTEYLESDYIRDKQTFIKMIVP